MTNGASRIYDAAHFVLVQNALTECMEYMDGFAVAMQMQQLCFSRCNELHNNNNMGKSNGLAENCVAAGLVVQRE